MNRRKFFGVSAGAAVAGPEVINQAVAGQPESSSREALYDALKGWSAGAQEKGWTNFTHQVEPDEAIRRAFKMGIISRETLIDMANESEMNSSCYNLDPDLQSAKSFSLDARMRMQRKRNQERGIDRFLSPPKTFWDFGRELVLNGLVKGEEK